MSWTVPVALYGWPLVVLGLFVALPPRRAVIFSFLFAWLFLPMAAFDVPGLPAYTKMAATAYAALLGTVLFDAARFSTLRPGWIDVPMLAWCVAPMASSVTNGLGVYDGLSECLNQIVAWGVPYLIGRLYLTDLESMRELAIGVFIGGLIYMPLCLFEARMSPRLHIWIYGYHQHDWRQAIRFGGWRPTVFMQHGLAVAMWMAIATVTGFCLWLSGATRQLWRIPVSWLTAALAVTTVLCKSAGAVILLVIGAGVVYPTIRWGRSGLLLIVLLAPFFYMSTRATGLWDGSQLLGSIEAAGLTERVGSLEYRIEAENILAEHALRQPVFGWGTWGRNRPSDMGYDAEDVATDGLWIITLGTRGTVGLVAMTLSIILPPILVWRRMPRGAWSQPAFAGVVAICIVLCLFMLDSLFNAMYNPIYMLGCGGLCSLLAAGLAQTSTARSAPRPPRVSVLHQLGHVERQHAAHSELRFTSPTRWDTTHEAG